MFLAIPLLLLGVVLISHERTDHKSSPAFTVALNRAVQQLEGAAERTTAAVTSGAPGGGA